MRKDPLFDWRAYPLKTIHGTFWDLIKIRYSKQLDRFPTKCVRGSNINIQHALSCKKGGFVTLRHNRLRDTSIASLFSVICKDVEFEPTLYNLTGEELSTQVNSCYELNEKEKILSCDLGSFTPVAFSANGGMGPEWHYYLIAPEGSFVVSPVNVTAVWFSIFVMFSISVSRKVSKTGIYIYQQQAVFSV